MGNWLYCWLSALRLEEKEILQKGEQAGYKLFKGRVGSMDGEKIFAAVETAAKRREIIVNLYREEHALYHSILDAFHGVCRGNWLWGVFCALWALFSVLCGGRAWPGIILMENGWQ